METSPYAGKTVKLKARPGRWEEGTEYRVEDKAETVLGTNIGNAARLFGTMSLLESGIPVVEDELLYGKVGYLGELVSTSEIIEVMD